MCEWVKAIRYDLIKFPIVRRPPFLIVLHGYNTVTQMRLCECAWLLLFCFPSLVFAASLSLSLFSLSLSLSRSLSLLALWINCLCLFRANLRQRQRQCRQRATTTFIDPVGKTKKACDIMFLTKVIPARFLWDAIPILNVVTRCPTKSAIIIGAVADEKIVASALIVNWKLRVQNTPIGLVWFLLPS